MNTFDVLLLAGASYLAVRTLGGRKRSGSGGRTRAEIHRAAVERRKAERAAKAERKREREEAARERRQEEREAKAPRKGKQDDLAGRLERGEIRGDALRALFESGQVRTKR